MNNTPETAMAKVRELKKIPKDDGTWVCENHPEVLWEECDCGGAGMPPKYLPTQNPNE